MINRLTADTVTLPGGHRVPIALLGVIATLLAAVIVVRGTRGRSAPAVASPQIGVSGADQSGELAALQGQLGSAQHQLQTASAQVAQDKQALSQLQQQLQATAQSSAANVSELQRQLQLAAQGSAASIGDLQSKLGAATSKASALQGQYDQLLELETQTQHSLSDLNKRYDALTHPATGNPDAGFSFGGLAAPSGSHIEWQYTQAFQASHPSVPRGPQSGPNPAQLLNPSVLPIDAYSWEERVVPNTNQAIPGVAD